MDWTKKIEELQEAKKKVFERMSHQMLHLFGIGSEDGLKSKMIRQNMEEYRQIHEEIMKVEWRQYKQTVRKQLKEAEKRRQSLSTLSLECILPHFDANKRICLAICFPKFRKWDNSSPLEIDSLVISPASITINENCYKIGEVHETGNISGSDPFNIKSLKRKIQRRNWHGGLGWTSLKGDVGEPGDLLLDMHDHPLTEKVKEEKMQEIREALIENLEEYFHQVDDFNPLQIFEDSVTKDRRSWPEQFSGIIARYVPNKIERIYQELLLLDYSKPNEEDELVKFYPNAFKMMKSKIEEMVSVGDIRWIALKKFAYPPICLPHFNQFTVLNSNNYPEYSNRLPDGLSLRHALKQFSTLIFGKRSKIQVGRFDIDGSGIIPLPVGFKLDCDMINDVHSSRSLVAYSTLVETTKQLRLDQFLGRAAYLRMPWIQNCRILQLSSFVRSEGLAAVEFLNNECLQIGIKELEFDCCLTVISKWIQNENREAGSQLIIASDKIETKNIFDVSICDQLIQMGLQKHEGYEETQGSEWHQWFLYLTQTGNKLIALSVRDDKQGFALDLGFRFDFYFYLEIGHIS